MFYENNLPAQVVQNPIKKIKAPQPLQIKRKTVFDTALVTSR
jgi:hypothetical protein